MIVRVCEHVELEIDEPESTLFGVVLDGVRVTGFGDFPADFECRVCGASMDMWDIERRLRPPPPPSLKERRQREEADLLGISAE